MPLLLPNLQEERGGDFVGSLCAHPDANSNCQNKRRQSQVSPSRDTNSVVLPYIPGDRNETLVASCDLTGLKAS